MSEDQFLKLYNYMTRRFDALEAKVDTKADAGKVDGIYIKLDAVIAKLEVLEHEQLAMNRQLTRHETWITKAARQLKIKYDSA